MIELLNQADIEITKVLPRRFLFNEEQFNKFCESMKAFGQAFNIDSEHIKDRSSVLQYVLSGHRKAVS